MSVMNTRAPIYVASILAACLLLSHTAWGEDKLPAEISDVFYKGIAGKALDAVPMDPEQRLQLQRANAVVSNTLTGRSLTAWAGLSNTILMIGGLLYGMFSASRIKSEAAQAPVQSALVPMPAPADVAQDQQPPTAE